MLAGMLAELGLFIGARTDRNNESPLFLALERRLLRQSGGSWQCPEALHPLLENAAARAMAKDYFRRTLVSPHVIGYLGAESPTLFASRLKAFHAGLATLAYTEGRNLLIEYRWAEGDNDRLPAFATELVVGEGAVSLVAIRASPDAESPIGTSPARRITTMTACGHGTRASIR